MWQARTHGVCPAAMEAYSAQVTFKRMHPCSLHPMSKAKKAIFAVQPCPKAMVSGPPKILQPAQTIPLTDNGTGETRGVSINLYKGLWRTPSAMGTGLKLEAWLTSSCQWAQCRISPALRSLSKVK